MWTWRNAFQYLEAARKSRMFDYHLGVWRLWVNGTSASSRYQADVPLPTCEDIMQHHFRLETSPGFSIVLPTLWPYLREMNVNTQFLAAVVAAYSVGEGCGGTNGSIPENMLWGVTS